MDEGKPAEHAEKIVNGRMSKLLAEYCLEDQPFVKEPSITVGKYLENHNSKLLFMKRFELGEGIIIAEHGFRDELPEITGNLKRIKEKRYGTIKLSIYRKEKTEDND